MAADNYADLLDLPHPEPQRRPRMPRGDRAAQFSSYAALTGLDALIAENGRHTQTRPELDASELGLLNDRIAALLARLDDAPEVTVTYFIPDARKSGGACRTVTGEIAAVHTARRLLVLRDGTQIPMDEILSLD